ncbi:hypothetical protein OCH239_15880 [Roseivivax halodurans JCM 10272]|uniref:Uncharacterized protein n=1 Tax=Roseivivax halodurans JCM 10272 TaxID=1449350 RepID=X7EHE1_9RHOB|nr:hypothetical protein OCH239_15880 [Roseivivax halodurans JCM 10272]
MWLIATIGYANVALFSQSGSRRYILRVPKDGAQTRRRDEEQADLRRGVERRGIESRTYPVACTTAYWCRIGIGGRL